MTVLLALVSVAGIAASVTAGRYRRIIRDLDVQVYDTHRTADDVRALDQQLAEQTMRAGIEHRARVAAEQTSRQITGLLIDRPPIPLPAHTPTPFPDYGNRP
jgi:hypothetical protein